MATASNETAMAVDDAQATVEARNSGAPARPPQPLVFEPNKAESWKIFRRRWSNYCTLSDIATKPRNYQVAMLENSLGDEAMRLYDGFQFATPQEHRTVAEILSAFDEFAIGEANETFERYKFNSRKQEDGESFEDFHADLRVLAKTCTFCHQCANSMTRDRIILGIRQSETRQELLKIRKLSLDVCVDVCRAAESAISHRSVLDDVCEPVHVVNHGRLLKRECRYCGRRHAPTKEMCPAYGKTCNNCGAKDNFERKCMKRRNTNQLSGNQHQRRVYNIRDNNGPDEDDDSGDAWVHSLTPRKRGAYAKCRMLVNGKQLVFQIDTGATVNMLPARYARDVVPYNGVLTMWNKTMIKPLGKCRMLLSNPKTETSHDVEFIVFKDNDDCQPILGLQTSEQMHLVKIQDNNFHRVAAVQDDSCFNSLFDDKLGEFPGVQHLTVNPEVCPRIMASRRIPIAIRPQLKSELEQLTAMGVIAPVDEPTPWVSQVVVVKKRSGALRVCIDPHELNKALQREHYTLPILEDVLHELQGATVFSKADLSSGYWHVKLDDESSLLTTFQTCFGRYRWCRLPFGTTVSSEVFQKHLLEALRGLPGIICIADDIVIYGKTLEEHDENLRKFFERCLETGIKLNNDKLDIGLKEVTFMGHRITKEGLRVDPAKVSAISEMQPPTNINELRRFMGMANYLARFMPHLTDTMQPLHNLLKNDVPYV